MNLDRYKFDKEDLIVAAAVNGYLKKMKPEAREKVLAGIVSREGSETVINGPALATLIENAKVATMVTSEDWQEGDDIYQKALSFIREQLPAVDGKKYVAKDPKEFLRFIRDWAKE